MPKKQDYPWQKIYDYVLECGAAHDPAEFVASVMDNMGELIPFDQGIAFFLDEARKIKGEYAVNIASRWVTLYREYYSELYEGQHGLQSEAYESFGVPFVSMIDWAKQPVDEFLANYINARGLRYTLAFVLFDLYGLPCALFSFDRTRKERFSNYEIEIIRLAAAQLSNLYKNFYIHPDKVPGGKKSSKKNSDIEKLTAREREVVDLLCAGFSPENVSKALHITKSTTYKHIQHIYAKLQVSSQQELLVRILK